MTPTSQGRRQPDTKRCCTFNPPITADIQGRVQGRARRERSSRLKGRGHDRHLIFEFWFRTTGSGMVKPATSLILAENKLPALLHLSSKPSSLSLNQTDALTVAPFTSLLSPSNLLPHAMTALSDLFLGNH